MLPYWSKGTAGVITTLVRYAKVTENIFYKNKIRELIPDISRKYAINPGLYNGFAGLGNSLLDCYQYLGDKKYLYEAYNVASGIDLLRINKQEGVAFPGDFVYRISNDFGTGSSGIGLFLHRLLYGGENFNFLLDDLIT